MLETKEKVEEEIFEKRKDVRYDIRDMTVEMIASKYEEGADGEKQSDRYNYIYIPEYQRDFVWDETRQSKLIESIIIGLPIPFIFVAENKDSSWEIVDGSQRIRTIHAFINNRLVLKNLETIKGLNGYRFCDLEKSRQGKILNTALRIIVLSEETTEDVKTDMFERINRGSDLLKPMETRRGSTSGEFVTFIEHMCEDEDFIRATPIARNLINRREREELLLRFYAFTQTGDYNKGINNSLSKYLDDYYKKTNSEWESMEKPELENKKEEFKNEIKEVLAYVNKNFPYGFRNRSNPQTKRSVFEAISIGVWKALKEDKAKEPLDKEAIEKVFNSKEFREYIDGANETYKKKKLLGRVQEIYDLVTE